MTCFFLTSNLRSLPDPSQLVPDDTVVFIKLNNLAKSAISFKYSPFGLEVFDPSLEVTFDHLQLEEKLKQSILATISVIDEVTEHPLFRAVFSKQSAVAVLPPRASFSALNWAAVFPPLTVRMASALSGSPPIPCIELFRAK